MKHHDIVIIGGGPAGLAAAAAARKQGISDILILERDGCLGGILNQCIHNGFGLHTFGEELTGPEYANRFIDMVEKEQIQCRLNTMVIDINEKKEVTFINREEGLVTVGAGAVILAMGCRERSRGALNIPGFRPSGVYSAGTAQRLMNIEGLRVGNEAVILGSGDIGLIMARRMTLEGAKVKAVAELMPYSGGLKRNIVQCLEDYGIPLKLNHTVVEIEGKERVTGVTLARVGADRKPVAGTEQYYACDTLLLSVGLLPENELTKNLHVAMDPVTSGAEVNDRLETGLPGVFACGNVLHVHDLVDFVSEEAALAGENAAEFVKRRTVRETFPGEGKNPQKQGDSIGGDGGPDPREIRLKGECGVRYTVPQRIDPLRMKDQVTVRFRVADVYKNRKICVWFDDTCVMRIPKRILAPGEMEQVVIKRDSLQKAGDVKEIRICTEEA